VIVIIIIKDIYIAQNCRGPLMRCDDLPRRMSRSFIDCKLFSILTIASRGPSVIAELLVDIFSD